MEPQKQIENWIRQGLLADQPLQELVDGMPETANLLGAELRFHVTLSGREVSVVFDGNAIPRFARPLFAALDQILTVPDYKDGHPIQRLAGNPNASWLKNNADAVFVSTMALIDSKIRMALRGAILDGRLTVTGVPAGNPLAKRCRVDLASAGRPFQLDLANNRIVFTDDDTQLVSVEVTGPVAEPGRAKSLEQADATIVEKLKAMLDENPPMGIMAAALELAKTMAGDGTVESKARRLRNRFKRAYPNWKRTQS